MGLCIRFLEILCAIILPPLGVFFRYGCCKMEFWLCVVLTILGYIPGIIYAIYVIVTNPEGHHHHDDNDEYRPV
ncbi:low temperature-induced protein lt101.2-like [Zingiber officinale]|nr:low temperature-induced protein lt101.2-like [Zingiber officinale]KAG6480225.1 hypothetical protein ZIOFF_063705 [Zingiber officinale]KAG6480230.1 hypothetical protein ZIOFF_063710 [Zingiber officinale]